MMPIYFGDNPTLPLVNVIYNAVYATISAMEEVPQSKR
jgi:hypothetical protein